VDYDAKKFKLAKLRPHNGFPDAVPFKECTISRLSGTSIGLIVFGVVLGLLILSLAGLWYWRRIRKRIAATVVNKEIAPGSMGSSNQDSQRGAGINSDISGLILAERHDPPGRHDSNLISPTTTNEPRVRNVAENAHHHEHYHEHYGENNQATGASEMGSTASRPEELPAESNQANRAGAYPPRMSSSIGSNHQTGGW